MFVCNQVDENMQRAQRRNACLSEKFWWRRDVGAPTDLAKQACDPAQLYTEMTVDQIVNGKVNRLDELRGRLCTKIHTFTEYTHTT